MQRGTGAGLEEQSQGEHAALGDGDFSPGSEGWVVRRRRVGDELDAGSGRDDDEVLQSGVDYDRFERGRSKGLNPVAGFGAQLFGMNRAGDAEHEVRGADFFDSLA